MLTQGVCIAAGAITGGAARSLITGTDFGDNVLAALPDVIGSTIGGMIARGVAATPRKAAAPGSNNNGGNTGEGGIPFIRGLRPNLDGNNNIIIAGNTGAAGSSAAQETDAEIVVTARRRGRSNGAGNTAYNNSVGKNVGSFNVVLNEYGKGSFKAYPVKKGEVGGEIVITGNQGVEAVTVTEFKLPSGYSEYSIRNEAGKSMLLKDYNVRSDDMEMQATYFTAADIAKQKAALNAVVSGSISPYEYTAWGDIKALFNTSTDTGYQLLSSANKDWASGSYVKGVAKGIGGIAIGTLEAVQWGAFEIPTSLARGHGLRPTAWDRRDSEIIAFAATGISGMSRRGAAMTVESNVSRVLTVEQAGANLAQKIGTNRVSVMTPSGRMQIDLAGKVHFEKSLGVDIPTPHVKFQELNFGPNGKSNLSPGTTRPATMTDIRTARKIIERRGQ